MTPCEHCQQPGQMYTIRYRDAAERRTRASNRALCEWHYEQYLLLQERWAGILLTVEVAF